MTNPRRLTFLYVNHEGKDARRYVIPARWFYGVSKPWYPEPGWLMEGYDEEKRTIRTFAVTKMREISEG